MNKNQTLDLLRLQKNQLELVITVAVQDSTEQRNLLARAIKKQIIDFMCYADIDCMLNQNLEQALSFSMTLARRKEDIVFVFNSRGRFEMFSSSQNIHSDNPIAQGKYAL